MLVVQKISIQCTENKKKTYIVQSESIDRLGFRCSEFAGLKPHRTGKKNDFAFYEKGPRSCSKTLHAEIWYLLWSAAIFSSMWYRMPQ